MPIASYSIATIDVAGTFSTTPVRIDAVGNVYGRYTTKVASGYATSAFVWRRGVVTTSSPPGGGGVVPLGVDEFGAIVGNEQIGYTTAGYMQRGATYATLGPVGATAVTVRAINTPGTVVVGDYSIASDSYGFVYQNGVFTSVAAGPVYAVSSTGAYAGFSGSRFFYVDHGATTPIVVPNPLSAGSMLINARDDVAGAYVDTSQRPHVFVDVAGALKVYDLPSDARLFTAPQIFGLDAYGEVAGTYVDNNNVYHSFLISNGAMTTLNAPGATFTQVTGMNSTGVVAGMFADAANVRHGFTYSGGVFDVIDAPNASYTQVLGVDDAGDLVGLYGRNGNHAFVATPRSVLTVTEGSNFTGDAPTGVRSLRFASARGAIARFLSSAFDDQQLSKAMAVIGDAGADTIDVTVDGSSFSGAGFVYTDWDGSDQLVVHGSDRPSSLAGSSASDVIYGGAGNDTVSSGAGDDALYGGGGVNWLDFHDQTAGVLVNLGDHAALKPQTRGAGWSNIASTLAGGYDIDLFNGFNNVIGSPYNDRLYGDAGDNLLRPGTGSDIVYGGGGNDTVDYSDLAAGVLVNLDNHAALKRTAAGGGWLTDIAGALRSGYQSDSLFGVENAIGTAFNDRLYGDDADNVFAPGRGADVVYGGGGVDTIDYSALRAGVYADLSNGFVYKETADAVGWQDPVFAETAPGNGFTQDLVFSVERVVGTNFVDRLYGRAGAILLGGGGDDILYSQGGRNRLYGGDGNDMLVASGSDTMTGGAGADRFTFASVGAGGDVITDFGSGADAISLRAAAFGAHVGDAAWLATGVGTSDALLAGHAGAGLAYNTATGALWFDPDGAGGAAPTLLATLSGAPMLKSTDIAFY